MNGIANYDQLFFESFPNPERHIDRLFVMGRLAGLSPVRPAEARVLEIGCSTALNLIPQAQLYPGGQFTGLDLSASQIEAGNRAVQALGLTNISLVASDIREFTADGASFDYIICHGMYSWVPGELRQVLMQKIGHLLASGGIAYLSFNTRFAWKRRQAVRETLLRYDSVEKPLRQRIARVRQLLTQLQELATQLPGEFGTSFLTEVKRTQAESDAILAHEYLNRSLETFTVASIEESARAVGLHYLGDARQRRNAARYLAQLDGGTLRLQFERAGRAERDDLFDAIEFKAFRAALLSNVAPQDTDGILRHKLDDLMISSPLVPVEIGHAAAPTFMMGNGAAVEIPNPPLAEMLRLLHEKWPKPVPISNFPEVLSQAHDGGLFENLVWNQMLELSHADFACHDTCDVMPCVSPYARYQAGTGGVVPTLKHEQCELNAFERLLITWLDGKHDRSQLIDRVFQSIESGALIVPKDGSLVMDRDFIGEQIDAALLEFYERGMFFEAARR